MVDINEYKFKKLTKMAAEIGSSIKEGGYIMAETCFALAYKVKEVDSQMKVNQMNIDKLKH